MPRIGTGRAVPRCDTASRSSFTLCAICGIAAGSPGPLLMTMPSGDHDKVAFDCRNYRAMRLEELKMAANVAAERVRKTGMPYTFSPMSSRERRILHLALRDETERERE